jgi:hypothetical protein
MTRKVKYGQYICWYQLESVQGCCDICGVDLEPPEPFSGVPVAVGDGAFGDNFGDNSDITGSFSGVSVEETIFGSGSVMAALEA